MAKLMDFGGFKVLRRHILRLWRSNSMRQASFRMTTSDMVNECRNNGA